MSRNNKSTRYPALFQFLSNTTFSYNSTGVLMVLMVTPFIALPASQYGLLMVFSTLPPAVLNYMVAEKYNQEPRKVASIVMLANLASVIIIPIALAFVLA
ncbi:hypothetical protein [Candidatus Vondammii sp. HM_W22]|uniref:hypothetical protein n=1 Tax=Candidatus Vondammii sp. HM_W22 TaxID=2687299 RepID=UPI002E7C3B53|nr:hypothetical protein [Candidatus Vondammii sp. HM_W22]